MQGIFQKENTDKALKYGIYRHLPTYEKIIRNLVSFYIKKTRNLILSEREYMYTKLRELPFFYVYPAYANFLLVQIQKDGLTSSDVFEACIREGLMIRDCSSFTGLEGEFVRFCIMDPEDNRRLLTVFQKISQSARKQV